MCGFFVAARCRYVAVLPLYSRCSGAVFRYWNQGISNRCPDLAQKKFRCPRATPGQSSGVARHRPGSGAETVTQSHSLTVSQPVFAGSGGSLCRTKRTGPGNGAGNCAAITQSHSFAARLCRVRRQSVQDKKEPVPGGGAGNCDAGSQFHSLTVRPSPLRCRRSLRFARRDG
jgi:hypothetical protein